jgi:hypothetical protein
MNGMPASSPIAPSERVNRADLPTLIAMAAIAGVLSTQIHEGLGHGGACVATGLPARAWGAFYFDCGLGTGPSRAAAIVEMAGSTMNLLLAALTALALRATPARQQGLRFFLWLVAAVNAMVWAGYFLFSGISGIGDWGVGDSGVLQGSEHPLLWRVVMTVGGLAAYTLITALAMRSLTGLTGGDDQGKRLAHRLATASYLTIGVVAIAVGVFNPIGFFILLASAAASSFGGASGLMWGQSWIRGGPAREFALGRSWGWIVAAIVIVGAETVVLGPTITFR